MEIIYKLKMASMASSYLQSDKRSRVSAECQYSLKAEYFSPAKNEDVDDVSQQAQTRKKDHEDTNNVGELKINNVGKFNRSISSNQHVLHYT